MPLRLGHFWSLCVEEQFYLIWPWLVFSIRNRGKLMWICASTLPICLAMRLMGQNFLPGWALDAGILDRATPFRLDALLLGGLLALWLRGPHLGALLCFARIAFPIAIVGALAWAVAITGGHIFHDPYPYPEWTYTWGLSAIQSLAALLLLVAIQPNSLVYRLLSLRPLRWLGRISYGAYVLHDIPHRFYDWIAYHLAPAHSLNVAAAIALIFTITLAWLSFRFFESPFLELKERWAVRETP